MPRMKNVARAEAGVYERPGIGLNLSNKVFKQ
jgi:hypothetical protein